MRDVRDSKLNDLGRRNFWLIVVTTATTVAYAGFCLWKMFSSGGGQNIESVLPTNPRAVLILCFAASTLTLLFLPELGRVVTAVASMAVLYLFYYWWSLTAAIKANLNITQLPNADWLGDQFVGAYYFDILVGVAALVILILDVRVLWKTIPQRLRGEKPSLVA
ncbi:MAG TPA: hypothetical protein VN844_11215 [Pyrinomonadaceae bacterium]|nr:hypothetical protein [Pyrinomonadaceae bacterium]